MKEPSSRSSYLLYTEMGEALGQEIIGRKQTAQPEMEMEGCIRTARNWKHSLGPSGRIRRTFGIESKRYR